MSLTRVFIWTCDKCGTTATKPTFGMPPSWSWGRKADQVTHLCDECSRPFVVGKEQERLGEKENL